MNVAGGKEGAALDARAVARSSFQPHLEVIDAVDGRGVWLPQSAVESLAVEPGDTIELQRDRTTTARVKGIYGPLTATLPLPDFWAPFRKLIVPPTDKPGPGSELPVLLLGDEATVRRLAGDLRWRMTASWELPLRGRDLTLPQARRLSAEVLRLTDRIPTATFGDNKLLFGATRYFEVAGERYVGRFRPTSSTVLPEITRAATQTVEGITPPVQGVAIIAAAVALIVLAAAGFYSVHKRSVEFRLVASRGTPARSLAAHAVAEACLPAVATWALSLLTTRVALEVAGPGRIDPAAFGRAAATSLALLIVGIVAFSVTVAISSERLLAIPSRQFRWKPAHGDLLLALGTAGSFVLMVDRAGQTTEGGRIDVLLVLLPLTAVGFGAALMARIARAALTRARRSSERSRFPIYLALRRLTGGSNAAVALIALTAVSVGLLIYTHMLADSADATTHAKSHVFVGSDVSVYAPDPTYVPDLGVPATAVVKIDDVTASGQQVDVLGIDTETFTAAAYWDEAFSQSSLEKLVSRLRRSSTDGLSVIAAGSASEVNDLLLPGGPIKLDVVDTATAFPGMLKDDPLLVVDKGALLRSTAGLSVDAEVWAKGNPTDVLRRMAEDGLAAEFAVTAKSAGDSPTLQSLTWTLSVLRVFGVALGALALGGLLLYLAARQRARIATYILMRRMELTPGTHRAALAIEIVLTLAGAVVFGTGLGAACAGIIYTAIDLLPRVPPDPLIRFPVADAGVSMVIAIVAAMASSFWLQSRSDRANPVEVLRADE